MTDNGLFIKNDPAAVGFGGGKPISNRTLRKFKARRRVMPGFPWGGKFTERKQVEDYFAGDQIVCLLCGRFLCSLGNHLTRIHQVSEDEYREKYGLPWRHGLVASATNANYSAAVRRRLNGEALARLIEMVRSPEVQAARLESMARRRPVPEFLRAEIMERCTKMNVSHETS